MGKKNQLISGLSKEPLKFYEDRITSRAMEKLGDSVQVIFESGFTGELAEVFANEISQGRKNFIQMNHWM